MRVWKLWVVSLVLLLIATGSSATTVAGRSEQQTFADPLVAALVMAVSQGDFGDADNALKAGANVNAVGVEGLTPLLWIMGTTLNVGKIEYLLKAGANPNYRDERSLISPMYLAAGGNRPEILEVLLKNNGNPNLTGPRSETLLMLAVTQSRDKNIDLLLKYGVDINQTVRNRETAANKAVSSGRYDLVIRFLESGLTHDLQYLARDVEVRQVPVDSDAQRWKDKVIEMLKERGAKFPAFIPRMVE
jgi:ankyrin repeat protein